MKTILNVLGAVCWASPLLLVAVSASSGNYPWHLIAPLFTTGVLAFCGAAVLDRLDIIAARLTEQARPKQTAKTDSLFVDSPSNDEAVRAMKDALGRH